MRPVWWLLLLLHAVGGGKVKELTDANFQAETEGEGGYFKSDDVWLVSFSAVWIEITRYFPIF